MPGATFAVVAGQGHNREKREPLDATEPIVHLHANQDDAKACEREHGSQTLLVKRIFEENARHIARDGKHDSPEAVIDREIGSGEEHGQDERHEDIERKCADDCQDSCKVTTIIGELDGVDRDDGEHEARKYALLEAAHREKEPNLAYEAEREDAPEVTFLAMRIEATLGDHVRKNGIRETADDPQDQVLGQQNDTDMVNRHRYQGEYFKLVSRHHEGYSIVSGDGGRG